MNETAPTGRWADLGPRVLSALVLLAIGAIAVCQGGLAFQALVVLVVLLSVWFHDAGLVVLVLLLYKPHKDNNHWVHTSVFEV